MKFFLIILSLVTILFTGCTKTKYSYLKDNIAECRELVFEGEKDNIKASLICGIRESKYLMDGYATEPKEFGVLTFHIGNIDDFDISKANYVISINSTRYDGDLIQNPFDKSLVADIGKAVEKTSKINAKIIIGEFVCEIRLSLVGSDFKIDADEALNIFADNYKDEISSLIKKGALNGEVYLKLVNDADQNISDYYWYVNMVSRENKNYSLIISPYTGEALAKSNGSV